MGCGIPGRIIYHSMKTYRFTVVDDDADTDTDILVDSLPETYDEDIGLIHLRVSQSLEKLVEQDQ